MIKSLKRSFFIMILSINGFVAQDMIMPKNKKLYDPTSDAKVEIANAVKKQKKRVNMCFYRLEETGADGA